MFDFGCLIFQKRLNGLTDLNVEVCIEFKMKKKCSFGSSSGNAFNSWQILIKILTHNETKHSEELQN